MQRAKAAAVAATAIALALGTSTARAKDKTPANITVAFGAGLNTASPGNTPNHHIIPQEFTVRITKAKKLDGTAVFVPATVNFVVSGFHWIWVYRPRGPAGRRQGAPSHDGHVRRLRRQRVCQGRQSGDTTAFADASVNPSGVMNRTDSFGFSTPGRYLVICNVRGHFVDGMYTWINVVDTETDDDD